MLEHEFDNEHDEDEKDPHFKGEYVFLDENAAKEALKPLFLNRASNPSLMKARMSILASALAHYHSGNYLAYPCNNNRFSGMQRYNGPGYNLSLPDEVKKLSQESKGLLQHIHQEPNAHKGAEPKQSSFRGTPKLFRMLGHLETKWVLHEPIRKRAMYVKGTEIMHFRKEKFLKYESRLIKYPDNWYADQIRDEIVRINEFLSRQTLRWLGFENKTIGHRHTFDSDAVLTSPLFITRSFARNDFGLYGRCHGFWQNKSKKLRPAILLNGEETAEPDYSQCHCNIAYLEKGLTPPDDAYNIEGYQRDFVKPALPIIFNAGDEESAINALAKKFHVDNEDAATLISKVKIAHSAISDFFHDDKGLRLMKIESDIAVKAMLQMVREGIPFLPIHDSFRCPVRQRERVKEIMVESFRDIYPDYVCHVKG